jgi:hypothetical protein
MKNRITPEQITQLEENQIFVFGSNEAGIHGAGAARAALAFGAEMYKGFGLAANTFAIPTKDWEIAVLPLPVIKMYVERFLAFAKLSPDFQFLVTPIGCGLAGYKPVDIAPLFVGALELENVHLPESFWHYVTL